MKTVGHYRVCCLRWGRLLDRAYDHIHCIARQVDGKQPRLQTTVRQWLELFESSVYWMQPHLQQYFDRLHRIPRSMELSSSVCKPFDQLGRDLHECASMVIQTASRSDDWVRYARSTSATTTSIRAIDKSIAWLSGSVETMRRVFKTAQDRMFRLHQTIRSQLRRFFEHPTAN